MLLKGFKRDLITIEYDDMTHALVLGYRYAHVVSSKFGVELFEYKDGRLQDVPSLINPTPQELKERLKGLKEDAKL